jgi:hypothetical protein
MPAKHASGPPTRQLLAKLLDPLPGLVEVRIDDERHLETAQRRRRLLDGVVDQTEPRQGAETARLLFEGVLDVADRGRKVAQILYDSSLVLSLREVQRLRDQPAETLQCNSVTLLAHRRDPGSHQRADHGIV